ncbi:MAG: hypothetical protein JWO32_1526 [Bacteroidetes bacterium]|nr:hypothetical protein [Bacteroidota bacterium]
MKKGTRFLTGLAAAAVAFGACFLIAGPDQFNKYGKRGCNENYYYHHCHQPEAGAGVENK